MTRYLILKLTEIGWDCTDLVYRGKAHAEKDMGNLIDMYPDETYQVAAIECGSLVNG
jgi:hypothetical protein